jgi:hypothetical protein
MKTHKYWMAAGLLVVGMALLLVTVMASGGTSFAQDDAAVDYPEAIPFASDSDDPVERGAYLAWAEIGCMHCHTGEVLSGEDYFDAVPSGGKSFNLDDWFGLDAVVYASNLTNLQEWSDDEIEASIRWGVRPDGEIMVQPMAYEAHAGMADADMDAIIAWIRSFEPVESDIPAIELPDDVTRADLRPHAEIPEDFEGVDYPEDMDSDPVVRGEYLAQHTTHCSYCHGQQADDLPDGIPNVEEAPNGSAFAGGNIIFPSIGQETTIFWTDDQLRTIIQEGVHPQENNRNIVIMPWDAYQYMDDTDVEAIIAWLRTLP